MSPGHALSPRQKQIMRLAARGLGDKEIATMMGNELCTIRGHWLRIFIKLRAKSSRHAMAIYFGKIEPKKLTNRCHCK